MADSWRQGRHAIVVPRAVAIALVASLSATAPAAAGDPEPPGIDAFMEAIAQAESGGYYYARNPTSGAYGKYQIMPSNWPAWAERYLGDARARRTPRNQEIVARGKIRDLYRWLGAWPIVAHWWLTGDESKDRAGWSASSRRYVDKVMARFEAATKPKPAQGSSRTSTPARKAPAPTPAPKPKARAPAPTTPARAPKWVKLQETHASLAYRGHWVDASHAAYWGGDVRSSNERRAQLTFRFTGSGFQWMGPKGPTRGKARVYVNGRRVRTIDLYADRFKPRNILLQRTYKKPGPLEVVIIVAGTGGRPTVAVDGIFVQQ